MARVWVSPGRARWLREERTVVEELSDGAVVVELPYGSDDWLVREVLKGVGDLVVLEPDDAREAVSRPSPAEGHVDRRARPGPSRGRAPRRPQPGPDDPGGTNTYVVATPDGAFVIDPGPDDDLHLSAIRAAAAPRGGIAGVLLTHGHADHTAAVASLGEPVLWGAAMPYDEAAAMAALFADPAAPIEPATAPPPAATSTAGPFEVVPTPGHATDHVCFVRGGVCFCGDLILGQGSSIVPPRPAAAR